MSIAQTVHRLAIKHYGLLAVIRVIENITKESCYNAANKTALIATREGIWSSIHDHEENPLKTIIAYACGCDPTKKDCVAFATAHELGHAYYHLLEWEHGDEAARAKVGAMRGTLTAARMYRMLPSERDADLFAIKIIREMKGMKCPPLEIKEWLRNLHSQWECGMEEDYDNRKA